MKKVEVLVQRTFVKEATTTVEVPSNLTGNAIREYLIEKYDGTQKVDELFESFELQHDQTTLVDVEVLENEYKVKWEIDLTASNPRDAATLALAMINASDSTAKVFNVDGQDIDLCEPTNEVKNLFKDARTTETNAPVYNQIPKAVLDQVFANGNVKGNVFALLGKGDIEFFADYVVVKLVGYKVYLYIDKGVWRSEIVEATEVTRGEFGGVYYLIDKQ